MERCIDWWQYQVWLHTVASRLRPQERARDWRERGLWVQPGQEGLYWRDLLTHTWFFVGAGRVAEITERGLALLKRQSVAQALPYMQGLSVSHDFAGEPNPEAALLDRLLPDLPDVAKGFSTGAHESVQAIAWRLGDTALSRTAIYNALTDGRLARPEHQDLRRDVLFAGLYRYICDPAHRWPDRLAADPDFALAQRLAFSGGAQVTGVDLPRGRHIGVVLGGSVKLKEYLFESSRLPLMRGASVLLDEINRERIGQLFSGEALQGGVGVPGLIPEGLLMAGGGNVLAIVPPSVAEETARLIERAHEQVAVTAQSVAVGRTIPADALLDQPGWASAVRAELSTLLGARQGVKLPLWVESFDDGTPTQGAFDLQFAARQGEAGPALPAQRPSRSVQTCVACRLRVAEFDDQESDGQTTPLCRPCWHRRAKGRAERTQLVHDYDQYARRRGIELAGVPPKTIQEIAAADSGGREGMFAVVYGDGNNIGLVLQRITELPAFHLFAERMQAVALDAVHGALAHTLGRREVEFLLLGGDDLFFLMPAGTALACAAEVADAFDLHFRNLSADQNGATMSVGVAIGHGNTAVGNVIEVGMQLLKSAKAAAKKPGAGAGTVDIVALEAFASFTDSLKEYRTATYARNLGDGARVSLTLRPFTAESARAMLAVVRALHAMSERGRSLVYTLRQAVLEMTPEEANLFCRYQKVRLKVRDEALMAALRRLRAHVPGAESAADPLAAFWPTGSGEWVSPWLDVAELWEYAGGGADGR